MGGALFIAPLADRIGRRPILIASTILFGAGTLATAWSTNRTTLTMMRVITGMGIGGAMPAGQSDYPVWAVPTETFTRPQVYLSYGCLPRTPTAIPSCSFAALMSWSPARYWI